MVRPVDPFSYLPLALPGAIVGLGLMVGCGVFLVEQGTRSDAAAPDSAHVAIRGHVQRADWVGSVAEEGPRLFLRVRLTTDPRSFIVAEPSLAETGRARIDGLARHEVVSGSVIRAMEGRSAVIVVDSSLGETRDDLSPYISALRVDGEVLVALGNRKVDTTPVWVQRVQFISLGLGTLLGLGIFGASVQHLAVCVRYWREEG